MRPVRIGVGGDAGVGVGLVCMACIQEEVACTTQKALDMVHEWSPGQDGSPRHTQDIFPGKKKCSQPVYIHAIHTFSSGYNAFGAAVVLFVHLFCDVPVT